MTEAELIGLIKIQFDWSTFQFVPQPVESVVLHFDPATRQGHLTPLFRRAD